MTLDLQTTIEGLGRPDQPVARRRQRRSARSGRKHTIDGLDLGRLRVAERSMTTGSCINGSRGRAAVVPPERERHHGQSPLQFYDKVPLKFSEYGDNAFKQGGYRVVPPAVARRGAYIARNVVLMPSYVNIGAYVDEGTMVDTWATVGSCAQIGKNVHLSGGVGIGGVLEPLQANPTIIEDNCFIGARSEVVEGVVVEETRCWPWACSCRKAPRSMTAPPARSPTAACRRARWWCRARCLRPTVRTAWPAP